MGPCVSPLKLQAVRHTLGHFKLQRVVICSSLSLVQSSCKAAAADGVVRHAIFREKADIAAEIKDRTLDIVRGTATWIGNTAGRHNVRYPAGVRRIGIQHAEDVDAGVTYV